MYRLVRLHDQWYGEEIDLVNDVDEVGNIYDLICQDNSVLLVDDLETAIELLDLDEDDDIIFPHE